MIFDVSMRLEMRHEKATQATSDECGSEKTTDVMWFFWRPQNFCLIIDNIYLFLNENEFILNIFLFSGIQNQCDPGDCPTLNILYQYLAVQCQ